MSSLPESITSIFSNHPELQKILPHPVQLTDHFLIQSVSNALIETYGKIQNEDFYQVIFKNGSSRVLQTIKNGELEGLLTTSCIRKGKYSDVAGLEKVNDRLSIPFLHGMLNVMIYRSLRAELSYITDIATSIRNHQINAQQAIFERISEVITDCYHCIPDIALDETLRGIQLTRIIKNSDDCFEIFAQQRDNLKQIFNVIPNSYELFYPSTVWDANTPNQRFFNIEDFLKNQALNHPVFSVFERLAAAKLCELLLSENYSDHNYNRLLRQLTNAATQIRDCFCSTITKLDLASERLKREANSLDLNGHQILELTEKSRTHHQGIDSLKALLSEKLEGKIKGLEILKRLSSQGEWSVYMVNGVLLVNSDSKVNSTL